MEKNWNYKRKIKNIWITSFIIGRFKRIILMILRPFFKFGEWHTSPINERTYAINVVQKINELLDDGDVGEHQIVEVGCGLGGIIGNINYSAKKKKGYDINLYNLRMARLLHPLIEFKYGTFSDVNMITGKIDCLIMVDFIHMISEEKMKNDILKLLKINEVKYFMMDTFIHNENTEYIYSHNGKYIFGECYCMVYKSEEFIAAHGAKRYIELWKHI